MITYTRHVSNYPQTRIFRNILWPSHPLIELNALNVKRQCKLAIGSCKAVSCKIDLFVNGHTCSLHYEISHIE